MVIPRQIIHHANVKMIKLTAGKNGGQCKQRLICFGIDGVRNTFQHLFNDGNGTQNRKYQKFGDLVIIQSENIPRSH